MHDETPRLARKGAKYIFTVAPIFSTPLILSYGNGLCVYLQSTYTNMLSCIAALFSRTTERARDELSCITRHDDRNSNPAPLTPVGRGPLNAPGRHAQTHF